MADQVTPETPAAAAAAPAAEQAAQAAAQAGQTPAQARASVMQSVITRAIGVATDVQPDFFSVDLQPGTNDPFPPAARRVS